MNVSFTQTLLLIYKKILDFYNEWKYSGETMIVGYLKKYCQLPSYVQNFLDRITE